MTRAVITYFSISVVLLGHPVAGGKPLRCAQCHRQEAKLFGETGMANALLTGAQSEILNSHPKLAFREGPYSYTIERRGGQSWYMVTDGKKELSVPIEWAFGLGAAGQTYVIRRENAWYESRVSYYGEVYGWRATGGSGKVRRSRGPQTPGSKRQ
jgi:hypothetical protein